MTTLCTENYRRFYNALQAETVSSDDILNLIPGALGYIAGEAHIGKFEVRIEIMPSAQDPAGYNISRVMYEVPDGFGYMAHTRVIRSAGKSSVSFAVFPVKDYTWTDDDKGALDHLIKNLYIIMYKARLTEQVNKRQLTDHLTSLPNTAYFTKFTHDLGFKGILDQYTIIFSNLRSFGYINQTLGSNAGDTVLKEYGHRLANLYGPGELIARFGGDNFVAILKNENVSNYLESISGVSIPVAIGKQTKTLTINARSGIYPMASPSENINEAINRADISLDYAKKVSDADCVWFTFKILARANREREIISYFQTALARHEFVVYYQPKVDYTTGIIRGCEALVRWKHNGELITPADFIPILESEGMICDLDFYVLERVCEDIGKWVNNGIIPIRVSVNFSRHHLKNEHLVDDIMSVVIKHEINPQYLEIELTESASGEDNKTLQSFVDDLNSHGIRTSIDDFGTGYSSLSLLKDLHVSVIKIDKSFIDNITDRDGKDRIILSSILSMVTGLGMDVIAEGCETAEQAKILSEMSCNTIQGYLYDKPLPYEDITSKLAEGYVYDLKS
ncbi:MAG: EAL domain-containing protein [Lachnospiraceae bacterium]|nr:EAL domain-containing protein [Lachnospiraceae bacterium]